MPGRPCMIRSQFKVEVNTERFNTVNLQAEIAKGMQQIMDATEKRDGHGYAGQYQSYGGRCPLSENADGGRKSLRHSWNRIHGTLRQMRRLMVHSRQISKSCWEKTPMVR